MVHTTSAADEILEVRLAGHLAVVSGDLTVEGRHLGGSLPRRAVAVLALEHRPMTRDELADRLWGDRLPRTWSTGLRGVLAKLRRALRTIAAEDRLVTVDGGVELAGPLRVDLLDAEADVAAAEHHRRTGDVLTAARLTSAAAAVLGHPLLPGDGSEWVEGQRRRFAEGRVAALLLQSNAAREAGVRVLAVRAARLAIRLDPMREAAHVALARAHLDGGDRTAALLALRRGEEVMRAELGVPLSPATVAFRREVLKSLETS